MKSGKTKPPLKVYYCERCGEANAGLYYVRRWAYDPRWGGWEQIGGQVMRLLCLHCKQYFDLVTGWALDNVEPDSDALALIDQRKAAGRMWYDEARGLWRMR